MKHENLNENLNENLDELERETVDPSDVEEAVDLEEDEEWEDDDLEEEDDTDYISEYEAEERYQEFLDDAFGDVTIAGLTYSTGYALKEIDPTAFRIGMLEWADSEGLEIL